MGQRRFWFLAWYTGTQRGANGHIPLTMAENVVREHRVLRLRLQDYGVIGAKAITAIASLHGCQTVEIYPKYPALAGLASSKVRLAVHCEFRLTATWTKSPPPAATTELQAFSLYLATFCPRNSRSRGGQGRNVPAEVRVTPGGKCSLSARNHRYATSGVAGPPRKPSSVELDVSIATAPSSTASAE
ncbi:hypothetical protein FN846DRAFT_907887 [Sphaerosporella brunnea]|uniref:Uncharacterized protein n=1 Tax=Sphaerosporella brunnea TaxID=1250544 RepID=A0A5J5EW14_9PEZI|nr:hypothetical protein FN846DRAFT_907887 [Sphaerosporella brunnea]